MPWPKSSPSPSRYRSRTREKEEADAQARHADEGHANARHAPKGQEQEGQVRVLVTDLAWAAGFIDGEGSIVIARNRGAGEGRGYRLKLTVSQVNPEPLLHLRDLFGGIVRLSFVGKGIRRPQHEWTVGSRDAIRALLLLRPYLIGKGAEADLAIAFQATKNRPGQKLDGWRIAEEAAVHDAMRFAHHMHYEIAS